MEQLVEPDVVKEGETVVRVLFYALLGLTAATGVAALGVLIVWARRFRPAPIPRERRHGKAQR